MQAYKNDKTLKAKFVKEIKWHEEQGKIIQGTYGDGTDSNFRGCAVGCSINSLNRLEKKEFGTSNHALYETELGIPEWLARLEDTIFEGLPVKEAKKWPLRFSKAIPVGANLEPVKWKFCAFILSENIERVLTLNISEDLKKQAVDSIRGVLTFHENAIKTGKWEKSAAESAESAWSAESAARSAAESAWSAAESAWSAESAAGCAAESAAWSAWSAARSARSAAESAQSAARSAWSAAGSARSAGYAARSAAYERYADKLIELLKASQKV